MTSWPFLSTPWQATPRVIRLCLLLMAAASLVCGVLTVTLPGGLRLWQQFVLCYGATLAAIWALALSRFLLLARDRIQLMLPGNTWLTPASLALYALGGLAPAMVLAIAAHVSLAATAIMLLVFMAGGLAIALLPGYVAAAVGFIPLIGAALSGTLPSDALVAVRNEVPYLLGLVALSAVCMFRWRRLARTDNTTTDSMRVALIFRLQWLGRAEGAGHERTNRAGRTMRGWSSGAISLKNTGPEYMSRALRVALGGLYLPRTLAGHARRWLPLAGIVLMMATIIRAGSAFDLPKLLSPSNVAFAICYTALVITMASTFGVLKVMQTRWRKQNAELALLALLPGMGTPEAARRKVLQACLAGPLTLHAAILFSVWLMAWLIPMPGTLIVLISAVIPGCSVIMVGSVLATLGGRRLPDWAMMTLMLVFLALTNVCLLPIVLSDTGGIVTTAYLAVPLAGWVLLGLIVLWLGFRGSLGARRRPHVFLPDGSQRST